jgi:tripeptidyl-peptidase-1
MLSSHDSPAPPSSFSLLASKMFAFQLVLQVLSISILVQAAAVRNVFESIKQLPRGWSFVRTANGTEPIKLRVSLKQQNIDHFYEKLLKVSTPDHQNYGMHYEGHELRSLLRPRDETSRATMNWLSENNITAIKDEGDYLLFSTDVLTANRMLRTEFGWYQARQTKQQVLRARSYSVPDEVRDHINFVQPTTRFGGLRPLSSTARI